ncbi:MAG: ribonuclease H-like domain-containing protein, partial [Lentisphaerae bacterium]|nr:ribonuclease H-like domain-containing protein [Lentisphaerota bacterium]
MIRGALLHLPGIGPVRAARLRQLGVTGWPDLASRPPAGLHLGPAAWEAVLAEAARCDEAYEAGDIGFFCRRLCGCDLWRILAQYGRRAAYVDIETDGLLGTARVTVIACYWQDRLYTFVQDENLDDFLELLEHIELVVTYNGTCFDVPMILRAFHIPELPCPHLDLRRVCTHAGLRGGLKAIEASLGLPRPPDLQGVDGAEAVLLWQRWRRQGQRAARDRLVRYCAADVVGLRGVGGAILGRCDAGLPAVSPETLWADLDEALPPPAEADLAEPAGSPAAGPAPAAAPRPMGPRPVERAGGGRRPEARPAPGRPASP